MEWFPILAYHRIVERIPADDYYGICTTREHFERQMRHLARAGYQTLPLEEVGALLRRNRPIPPKRFAITFDDGYEDVISGAVPTLQELGFTATIFVVSGLVSQTNHWDAGKCCLAPLLSWDQLRQLLQSGFSIGSHTISHPDLSELPNDVAWREIAQSRRSLERMLHTSIRLFCYPYGKWSRSTRELVREAGYELACNDIWRPEHELYALARVNARYSLTPWMTELRLQKTYFTLRRLAQMRPHSWIAPRSVLRSLIQTWRQGASRARRHTVRTAERRRPGQATPNEAAST